MGGWWEQNFNFPEGERNKRTPGKHFTDHFFVTQKELARTDTNINYCPNMMLRRFSQRVPAPRFEGILKICSTDENFQFAIFPGLTQIRKASTAVGEFGSTDGAFEKDRIVKKAGDGNQREYTYFVLGGARFIYASAARLALIKVP